MGLVAAANRRALQEWRRGGDNFKAVLRRIAAPDRRVHVLLGHRRFSEPEQFT